MQFPKALPTKTLELKAPQPTAAELFLSPQLPLHLLILVFAALAERSCRCAVAAASEHSRGRTVRFRNAQEVPGTDEQQVLRSLLTSDQWASLRSIRHLLEPFLSVRAGWQASL